MIRCGTFTMYVGTVSGNEAGTNGGGVYVDGGAFTMNDGTIGGTAAGANTATNGGGVYVGSSGTFDMYDGTVSSNMATGASGSGGGVYVGSGTFSKSSTGGVIYGKYTEGSPSLPEDAARRNTASSDLYGHAVYVPSVPLKRNSTAGTTVDLDSTYSGSIPGGNWE